MKHYSLTLRLILHLTQGFNHNYFSGLGLLPARHQFSKAHNLSQLGLIGYLSVCSVDARNADSTDNSHLNTQERTVLGCFLLSSVMDVT